jgi:hypothetical protein
MANNPGVIYRDASVVTARPVVPPPIAEPTPPYALAGGSQLNRPAVGGPTKATQLDSGSSLNKAIAGAPWPTPIIDPGIQLSHGWKPNGFKNPAHHNSDGNYGGRTSIANFGFRKMEFNNMQAGMPDSSIRGNGHRPEWNNLIPVVYALRVTNPVGALGDNYTRNPQSVVSQFTSPMEFTTPGVASLSMKGEVLL